MLPEAGRVQKPEPTPLAMGLVLLADHRRSRPETALEGTGWQPELNVCRMLLVFLLGAKLLNYDCRRCVRPLRRRKVFENPLDYSALLVRSLTVRIEPGPLTTNPSLTT